MSYKLKSYTIVPDSLYVERKADLQLHGIVEAMQRPGYVLVSRQMGKTNLLLRAKRKWENSKDLYVYVDMSNVAESERACFETLIDTAIDTHEEILSPLREKIKDMRRVNITKSPVQAHNEELRTLLKVVNGKLVFILDEIDSLTRTSYSDNVFSQIRSVYFSRVNYPVLEKLTYVLSGVVEPTEIIKNPKISPFNIGEKILLEDFTRKEYSTFIEKAELQDFGQKVIDRIYYWTGGNPRMTWDICYALQNKEGKSESTVDSLVKEMYLTSFDIAPIDTIRSLVKEDRDLRDAIIQLAYDKGDALSDKTKGKLYLSGIVNYSDSEVKIKNLIIKESLSLNWLRKVEEEEKGQIPYAMELHAKGLYQESLDKFESYLKGNEFPEANAPYCYYCMGACCYHLQDFERSLSYLTLKPLDLATTPYEYRHAQFLAGANCLKLGRYDKSLEYFKKAMSGETRDWVYYSAWLNSLTSRQRLVKDDEREILEIEKDYEELLALPNESGNIDIKIYAALEMGAMIKVSNPQKANEVYDKALGFAGDKARIRILVEKFEVENEEERKTTMETLVQEISKTQEVLESLDPDNNLGLDENVFTRAVLLVYLYNYEKWLQVKEKLSLLPYSYGDALYKVFLQVFTSSAHWGEGASRLIKELHDSISSKEYNITTVQKLQVYKYNAFFNFDPFFSKEYLDALKLEDENIDSIGLVVARSHALQLLDNRKVQAIIRDLEWITERYPVNMSHSEMANRALVDYSLLMAYLSTNNISSVQSMSRVILSYVDDEISTANGNTRENLLYIKKMAIEANISTIPQEPIRHPKTYGRNERIRVRYIQSNQIVEKKFKHLEADLKNNLCVIVEN